MPRRQAGRRDSGSGAAGQPAECADNKKSGIPEQAVAERGEHFGSDEKRGEFGDAL